MKKARSRLFVITDPTARHQVALVKALLVAKMADCEIHAFLCIDRDASESAGFASHGDFKEQSLADAEQWLERQLEPCRVAQVPLSTEIVWDSNWHDAALHSIARADCDLVIKSSFHHSKARRFYGKTSDYNLMRHCACPVLFVLQAQEWHSNRVLACVDLESTDNQHARLNGVVVRDARGLADIVAMDLYIAAAHRGDLDADNLPLRGHGQQVSLDRLGELFGVEPERVLLRRGETLATLKNICDEIDPSIVVLGTLARRGLRGKLIGNTAEKLLDLVDADVLTVN